MRYFIIILCLFALGIGLFSGKIGVPEEQTCIPTPLPTHQTVDGENMITYLQAQVAIQQSIIATLTSRIEKAQRNLQAP